MFSVTYFILRFAIVQNRFQQTNKTKINHMNDNHIKFEVSLHFWGDLAYCAAAPVPSASAVGEVVAAPVSLCDSWKTD